MRTLSRAVLVIMVAGTISASQAIYALGEYDGIWAGMESIVFLGETYDEMTGTVIYQESENTLYFGDELFGAIRLVKSGSNWILPAPLETTYSGMHFTFYSMSVTFHTPSTLSGTISGTGAGYPVSASWSHTKQPCQTLANGVAVPNLSGGEGSVRCYEMELPSGATDLNVETAGGPGDCDILVVYSRPDFDLYYSENEGNDEEITVYSPNDGKWYIVLIGWEPYSGLTLSVEYQAPAVTPWDYDRDGDVDGSDLAVFAKGPIDPNSVSAFASQYGVTDYL